MGILDTAKEAVQLVQKIDNVELFPFDAFSGLESHWSEYRRIFSRLEVLKKLIEERSC